MTDPVFDPDDDPAQVAAARTAAERDPLGEPDAIRAEAAAIDGEAPIPRDAATLILYRLDDDQPRILMGCRSAGHDFMPDKYVFPGGRVDEEDVLAPSLTELRPDQDEPLRYRRPAPDARLSADRHPRDVRGDRPHRRPSPASPWARFLRRGPNTTRRAWRPASSPSPSSAGPSRRRCGTSALTRVSSWPTRDDALIDDRAPVDGHELADLRWFTLKEAGELDLPNVTRFVISEIEARLLRQEALRPFHLYWSSAGPCAGAAVRP